ncbi:MAG: hypothetical protein ABR915_22170 [Thermoguttaceae bacterium]
MPKSILDAIKEGFWDFEPRAMDFNQFDPSDAMPGTDEKIRTLAERIRRGVPLWHASDRSDIEAPAPARLRSRSRRLPR